MASDRAFPVLALLLAAWLLPGSGAAAQGHGGGAEGPQFIKMEPLVVTVFDRGASRGRITIELQLEIVEEGQGSAVQGRMPRLYDGFLSVVSEYAGTRIAVEQPPNLDFLMARFQSVADQALRIP